MAIFQVAYRMTVYFPRSVDRTENTVMTPAAGAIHSDPFQVASISGLSGYKPYLDAKSLQGRKSQWDPKAGILDSPFFGVTLLDQKVSGYSDNLHRWVTAFIGDASGVLKLIGCRVVIEESIDNGTTWNPYYVGRINQITNTGALQFQFKLRPAVADDLTATIFNAAPSPSASNAVRAYIWPVGLSNTYGSFNGANTANIHLGVYTGVATNDVPNVIIGVEYGFIPNNNVNLVTAKLIENLGSNVKNIDGAPNLADDVSYARTLLTMPPTPVNNPHRIRIKDWSSGSFVNELELIGLCYSQDRYPNTATHFLARPVSGSDPAFISASVSTSGSFFPLVTYKNRDYNIGIVSGQNAEAADDNPVFINDTHPAQVMRDVLLGYYATRYVDGRPARQLYVKDSPDNANDKDCFSALLADQTFGTYRGKITKPMAMNEFLQKHLVPFGLGYRIEPRNVSGTIQSVFVPFDNRLPTSSSLVAPTITTALVTKIGQGTWQTGTPIQTLKATYYLDSQLDSSMLGATSRYRQRGAQPPSLDAGLMQETQQIYQELIVDQLADTYNAGGRAETLDLPGVRGELSSVPSRLMTPATVDALRAQAQVVHIYTEYMNRFARGPASYTLTTMRTGSLDSASVGRWVAVQNDVLPDPATHLRGGVRIAQVIGRTEMGPSIQFTLLDSGQNAATPAPTVSAVTSSATMSKNTFWTTVTIPSNNLRLRSQYAITPSGSTQPAATSSLWTTISSSFYSASGNYTVTFYGMPANSQIWSRYRTETDGRFGAVMTLPSDWVFPNGNGYWLTDALAAPTHLQYSNMTVSGVHLSWSTGSTNQLGLYVASPTSSTSTLVRRLEPNTTSYDLTGLNTGSQYNPMRIELTHIDPFGGQSVSASVVFTLSGSAPSIPVPRQIRVNP